jgi:spermidine/putrescine transport system ATP-binding protein
VSDIAADDRPNRLSARCTAVEYFGSVRRHIFERPDGEILKYDQFGAEPGRIAAGQTVELSWRIDSTVLHAGSSS